MAEKEYPVQLQDVIDYFDKATILCVDEPDKKDLMGLSLSVVKYLEELKTYRSEHGTI